jgi:Family of unknown function (DUF6476)
MRGLKILVVVMGIILIVGFAVLVAAIAGRMSRSGSPPTIARTLAGSAIDIPRGARIEAMTVGTDRLVVALTLPEGGRQLVIVDLVTGARLGTIELRASP